MVGRAKRSPEASRKRDRRKDGVVAPSKRYQNVGLAARCTTDAVRGIDVVALERGLTFEESCFLVLVKMGVGKRAAADFIRPGYKETRQKQLGRAMWKRLSGHLEEIRIDDCIRGLADVVAIKAMLEGKDVETRLKGADQVNKTRQRYAASEVGSGLGVVAGALAMAARLRERSSKAASSDAVIDAEVVKSEGVEE